MTTTTKLGLTDFVEGQKGAATKLNDNQDILDTVVQIWVLNGTPPTTPPISGVENGHAYIVPAGATGDWDGQDDNIAVFRSGWTFLVPQKGWLAHDEANYRITRYLGDRWQPFQAIRIADLADNTTGSKTEVELVTTGVATADNNFATLYDEIVRMKNSMILAGLMAGDAQTEIVDEAVGITETVIEELNPA